MGVRSERYTRCVNGDSGILLRVVGVRLHTVGWSALLLECTHPLACRAEWTCGVSNRRNMLPEWRHPFVWVTGHVYAALFQRVVALLLAEGRLRLFE